MLVMFFDKNNDGKLITTASGPEAYSLSVGDLLRYKEKWYKVTMKILDLDARTMEMFVVEEEGNVIGG